MPESSENKKKMSTLESELYLLIAKFLRTGPCKRTAEVLKEELEEHKLLPKRIDWLGNEHNRSFNELDSLLSQIADDHLLRICARIGPILDKELPPTVSGLKSLVGVGHQSLLRTKEDLEKPKYLINNLAARQHGMPLYPSPVAQSTYPPNIAQVLHSRELSGAITSRHAFSPKIYARQQPYRRLLGHLSSVYCVLFDRTGQYIFTGADDNLVKIWSSVDGRLLASLRGHSAEITDMAVNYENTLLAAGSCDKTIRVWCLRTTSPIAVLNGHTGMVTSLQFCPYPKNKDQLLISTGNDGCICFWQWNPQTNVFNPKPLKFTERNKAGAQMICSSFSSGGLFLATGSTDHSVRVYNVAGFNGPAKILEREIHTDRVDSLQFSNFDCRFVSGSKDGTALIWKYERQNWSTMQLKMSTKLPSEVSNEAEDSKVKLRVTMVGWTLDDSKVVTAVSDYSIKVWNSYNGTLCHILKGHEDEVFVLEAHPTDSRIFLSSGHDGRIILWDLASGSAVKNHFNLIEGQGHGAVFDCKFSPDGLMFASTDSHGHLCIFGYGSNERYKKVPEEQFFHTDYRPLIRDINHHVLDEQTQTPPHLLPPPFLVDIDGNPYPPNLQRLVPGREQCNDSQLIPYVAVFAEGESEILQPVRPANDGSSDRPTIDDMIERLQQEQQNQNHDNRDSSENGNQPSSSDAFRSPRSNRRRSSANEDRNPQEPFSPRTPRSLAGHSRVGLRRTGDVEGVQSVGNWQSRVNQGELPAWVKRVVVRPINASLAKSYLQRRQCLADYELGFFNKELKRRAPDPSIEYKNEKKNNSRVQRRSLRASARSRTQDENFNNVYGEEFENPERMNLNTSTDTESEQEQDESSNETSDDSGSEYSDWIEDVRMNTKHKGGVSTSKPSTSGRPGPSRQANRRKAQSSHFSDSSDDDDDESEGENDDMEEDVEDEESTEEFSSPKKTRKKGSTQKKKTLLNGKKIPERFRPPEWLTDVMPHKAPYVPQIGDEIVYFRQGHELYVQAVKRNRIYDIYMRSQPWTRINLRDQEVARIEDITFENHPPRLCCLKLLLLNPASKQADTFTVKYHDMADVIDFIVLKQNYDQAMFYDWKPGDRFRSAIDKAWWLGTIKSQKPLNPNFPDSMFQCFLVKWDNGEKEHMSPWDFEPIDNERLPEEEGGSVEITPEERQAMMYVPEPHEWSSFGRDHDCDRISRGLTRIMELSIAEPFVVPVDLNLYPSYAIVVEYPMDLGTIKARVQNRFYRRLDALKFDVNFIYSNAKEFNVPGSRIVKQAKCVVDLCIRFIDSSHCADPMIIYHEMMEAKQSRSQDSQSELDVLCSESDSDGDQNTTKRLKRKKQNAMQQSSKRVRLGSQKYTSDSWKQQCSSLVDSIFQMDDSTPFQNPVSLNEYPDYRNIIDCPMDLSTVRQKLEQNHYYNPTDFCKDMRLIFQNSRNYNTNKRSRIYSMTIRLSAMFEEHIRGIVSDWRSAVKYEEKIRNNQYVSNRRKPIPVQTVEVNVGASTSRAFSSGLPSTSRGESSRSSNKIMNTTFLRSKGSHSKVANGTGPKKLIKSERLSVMKSSHVKRKHMSNSIGTSLTNGITKKQIIRVSKRKLPEKTSKKRVQNTCKRDPSNTEGSRSDSNASNQFSSPESSETNECGRRVKRMRRETNSNFQKKLRPRTLPKHKRHSSSRHSRRLGLRSRSSSPDNHVIKKSSPLLSRPTRRLRSRSSSPEKRVINVKKSLPSLPRSTRRHPSRSPSPEVDKTPVKKSSEKTLSPLHTRSQRNLRDQRHLQNQRHLRDRGPIIHSLRDTTMKPKKYHNSGDSSESDELEVHNRKSARISNSSSSSNTSNKNQKNQRRYKRRKSLSNDSEESKSHKNHANDERRESLSNESEEISEHEEISRPSTRATRYKTKATRSALTTAPTRESPKKFLGRIQTRNRGQRTVMYREDSEDENYSLKLMKGSDSDNTEQENTDPENTDPENTEPENTEPENNEPVLSFSSRGRLLYTSRDTERRECDSIEENLYNGDTSLSETEVNPSQYSSTENESETECENGEKYNSAWQRSRLRPRKRVKRNTTFNIQSSTYTDNSSSLSSFKGSSRSGKYKKKYLNSNRIFPNYRKAMQGKAVLPILCEKNETTKTLNSEFNGRRRSRKSKTSKPYNLRTGSLLPESGASHTQYQKSFYKRSLSLQTGRPTFSRYCNSTQSKIGYRRMSLKKLGLNYRRKAMLCKIVLPILCVKNKVSFQSSGRGRLRRKRNRRRKTSILRNELFKHSSSSNSSLKKSGTDGDHTNSSQSSATQSKYNLKVRRSPRSYHESSGNKTRWNIRPRGDQIRTRYQGQRIVTYNENSNDSDRTENDDEHNNNNNNNNNNTNNSDTCCSMSSSAETSILYYTGETEVSSDTLSLSTQGSKDTSESSNLHLQNHESVDESVHIRNTRQTNSVYENVDVFCNNAVMFDGNSCQ